MKRALVAAVLFFAGLFVLRELERRANWVPAEVENVEGPAAQAGEGLPGVAVRGRFRADLYQPTSDAVAIRVTAEDSLTKGDADELDGVELVVFGDEDEGSHGGPGGPAERARIQAEHALLPRDTSSGLEPRYAERVDLTGVRGTLDDLLRGSSLAIETPAATIHFSDPGHVVLESERTITIDSAEFEAGGRGFQLDVVRPRGEEDATAPSPLTTGREDIIELSRDGWMEFRPEQGLTEGAPRSGRIESTGGGPMQIRRSGDADPRPIAFEVWDGASLELFGTETWLLRGKHLLFAGAGFERLERIRPREVRVDGEVSWTSGTNVFTGDRGEVTFGDGGAFRSARIDGDARARIRTSFERGSGAERTARETDLDVRTEGAIEVARDGAATTYRVSGPATVSTGGVEVRSNGDLTGRRTRTELPDGKTGETSEMLALHGTGGVRVEAGGGALETAEFDLETRFTAAGEEVLRGVASGGARLVGTDDESGRIYTITSPKSLEVERRGGELRLVRGETVEVAVSDAETQEEVLFARCDELRDLSIADLTFQATGHVLYRRGATEARCASLEAFEGGHFRMRGDAEVQARLTTDFGEALADDLELDGERLHAHGRVGARLAAPSDQRGDVESYTLGCEDLVAFRTVEDLGDGTALRRLVLDAGGGVTSTIDGAAGSVELTRADLLHVVQEDQLTEPNTGGEQRLVGSTTQITARGSVDASMVAADVPKDETRTAPRADLAAPLAGGVRIQSELLRVRRSIAELGSTRPDVSLVASGSVRFQGLTPETDFHGEGDRLRLDPDGSGHLDPEGEGRVRLYGLLPTHGLPFELTADHVDFENGRIDAIAPDLVVKAETPTAGEGAEPAVAYRTRARRLVATRASFELIGEVVLEGATQRGMPWTLRARHVSLQGSKSANRERPAQFSKISATGGVVFELGEICTAHAESLHGVRPTEVLRLTGSPAVVEFFGRREEAEWMDFDPELGIILEAGRGTTYGQRKSEEDKEKQRAPAPDSEPDGPGGPGGSGGQSGPGLAGASLLGQETAQDDDEAREQDQPAWSLEKLWLTTRVDQDSFVICIQEPVFRYPALDSKLRCSWAILWVDREKLERLTSGEKEVLNRDAEARFRAAPLGPMRVFFDLLAERGVSGLVTEAYFEGPVEIYEKDRRTARADAVYLDTVTGHGWLSNATVTVYGGFLGDKLEKVTIRSKWLRHSSDGSLRADNATVTSCDFEEPHVKIVTGDLRLTPLSDELDTGYEISVRDNRIELYDFPQLPLPSFSVETDDQLKPQVPSIRLGNSARFGQLFGFKFSRPAKKLGGVVDGLFSKAGERKDAQDGDKKKKRKRAYEARYDLDASYLGSRGVLLDLGFTTKDRNDTYRFDFRSAIAPGGGEDRGYVRVPEDERSSPRLWLRSHGWVVRGDDEYRLAYTDQSDPGVQAEFFESEFATYEEFENYLQWKRRGGTGYSQVTIKPRVDTFRADVEELPSATFFRGREPIGSLFGTTILHSGELDAAYLRRRAPRRFDLDGDGIADGPITSPFHGDGTFDEDPTDPTGEFEVLRADLVQELEAPVSLGAAGMKLVPFVRARGTAWDRAVSRSSASRLIAEVGARLATVFWKPLDGGRVHQVSPYLGIRRQLGSETRGVPHVFDGTESALFGDFVEAGVRSRFGVDGDQSLLDLDLRSVYASDRSDGKPDGWLPLETYARFGIAPGGRVFDVWYDARFDPDASEFVYSLFSLGTRFGDDAGLQVGHTYGRDDAFQKIFDAATISGFYRWSEKWEVEGRQTISLLSDSKLGTGVVLRRYGHDLIFELETSFREGEGSAFNLGFRPRLGFRPNRIGYIRW